MPIVFEHGNRTAYGLGQILGGVGQGLTARKQQKASEEAQALQNKLRQAQLDILEEEKQLAGARAVQEQENQQLAREGAFEEVKAIARGAGAGEGTRLSPQTEQFLRRQLKIIDRFIQNNPGEKGRKQASELLDALRTPVKEMELQARREGLGTEITQRINEGAYGEGPELEAAQGLLEQLSSNADPAKVAAADAKLRTEAAEREGKIAVKADKMAGFQERIAGVQNQEDRRKLLNMMPLWQKDVISDEDMADALIAAENPDRVFQELPGVGRVLLTREQAIAYGQQAAAEEGLTAPPPPEEAPPPGAPEPEAKPFDSLPRDEQKPIVQGLMKAARNRDGQAIRRILAKAGVDPNSLPRELQERVKRAMRKASEKAPSPEVSSGGVVSDPITPELDARIKKLYP